MSNFNLLQAMKNEQDSMSSGERDETPKPKNPSIFISKKKTPELTLRILPSLSLIKGEEGAELGIKQRTIFFNLQMTSKVSTTSLTLPQTVDLTNATEQKVNMWTNENFPRRMRGTRDWAKPSATYWLNVLLLERDSTGSYQPKLNEAGVPQVYAFHIGWSGYSKILKAAANEDYAIPDANGTLDSFVSFGNSFPVKIGKATDTEFSVEVLANKPLPPIEDLKGVASQLEDFSEIIKPTDVTQPNWFQSVTYFLEEMGNESESQPGVSSDFSQPQGLDFSKPDFNNVGYPDFSSIATPEPFADAIPTKATPSGQPVAEPKTPAVTPAPVTAPSSTATATATSSAPAQQPVSTTPTPEEDQSINDILNGILNS